jgi:hypothetical protein
MATKSSVGCIASVVVLIPLLIVAWYMAPLFLPMWRWQNLDFEVLSQQTKRPKAELEKKYKMLVRFGPRNNNEDDPIPWQVLSMSPAWDKENETDPPVMVRVSMLSDQTGEMPSGLLAGVGRQSYERFFRCDGWRLPPGTFGQDKKRPVVIIDMGTWQKVGMNEAIQYDGKISDRKFETDDKWEDRDDGWTPGGVAP